MNWKQIEDSWERVSGRVKAEWETLLVKDPTGTATRRLDLVTQLQQRYDTLKGGVEKQVNGWLGKAPPADLRRTQPSAAPKPTDEPD